MLLIAETLYLKYLLLFLFDNTTSHFFNVQNALYIANINKRVKKTQSILYNK